MKKSRPHTPPTIVHQLGATITFPPSCDSEHLLSERSDARCRDGRPSPTGPAALLISGQGQRSAAELDQAFRPVRRDRGQPGFEAADQRDVRVHGVDAGEIAVRMQQLPVFAKQIGVIPVHEARAGGRELAQALRVEALAP